MKILLSAIVAVINALISAYLVILALTVLHDAPAAQRIGALLASAPFGLVAYYGFRPGSRAIWGWAFGLNAAIFLFVGLVLGVVGSLPAIGGVSYSEWSTMAPLVGLVLINLYALLARQPAAHSAQTN